MKSIIDAIAEKHRYTGIDINDAATHQDISVFEERMGFSLPVDFIEFYRICNGFWCNEDMFNMITLSEIGQHPKDCGVNWFYFSEYMIYADMWGLRLTDTKKYEIFNGSYPTLPMTSSLEEFLDRFLKGNIFDPGGLYDWQDELKINSH